MDFQYGLKLKDYYFDLPENLIAQNPVNNRDESNLLVYDVQKDSISHKKFYEISDYFSSSDTLVLNNSKVIKAKLIAKNILTSKLLEIILISENAIGSDFIDFIVLTKLSKIKLHQVFSFQNIPFLRAEFVSLFNSLPVFRFNINKENFYIFLDKYGKMPLPPYIKRDDSLIDVLDIELYQTVYAKNLGSIAAPTAGLHFTEAVLDRIKQNGAFIKYVTLHVGMGTFKPVKVENIHEHNMLAERYHIDAEVGNILLNSTTKVTSVGTTTTRTVESFLKSKIYHGETDIFISLGHKFYIDRLITNFHVPCSTPLILLTAFIYDRLIKNGAKNPSMLAITTFQKIYKEAIKKNYRFYSYGDSMFVY